ncbi:MAG TPA: hypothetical protein VEA80_13060 [Vitreimonas sp.]|uniref:hypothetical protein n=1 Tax=Vitreimonas sp. TaxID=3069702 RepID=UPI002D554441|nr:hypothetical protein [Vitreimonas sp.]HYD88398.1 hypothetical protein [Vitreimonas sp.]
MRGLLFILATAFAVASPAAAQDYALEQAAAGELRQLCSEDSGRLWGVSLCGPLIVVDPQTRAVWASDQDREGRLTSNGGGWIGTLPAGVTMANTSVEWAGVRWIMVLGPLPADASERRVLVGHEAWHRAQAQIGLPTQSSDNPHLASERGRYFMRLEMRALAAALRSSGSARERAAEDALAFRRARYAAFPEAFAQEAALDRNEGLAAYTGVRLGAENPMIFAARTLDAYDGHDALARAYAYATGPAYGLLLDEYNRAWRQELGAFAPADLLAAAVRARTLSGRELQRDAQRYGGAQLEQQERVRAEAARSRSAELRRLYAEGPRLELPLMQMQMDFDPNAVTPVEGLGSFYGRITLRDRWGELVAAEGALINATFTRATAAAPRAGGITGPGWRLTLNPAWRITAPDARGVVRVEPAPPAPAEPAPG